MLACPGLQLDGYFGIDKMKDLWALYPKQITQLLKKESCVITCFHPHILLDVLRPLFFGGLDILKRIGPDSIKTSACSTCLRMQRNLVLHAMERSIGLKVRL